MTDLYKRILEKKKEVKMTWDEIAQTAKIRLGTWMTGLPTSKPSEEEIEKLAKLFNTTADYLKNGIEK